MTFEIAKHFITKMNMNLHSAFTGHLKDGDGGENLIWWCLSPITIFHIISRKAIKDHQLSEWLSIIDAENL